MFERRMTARRWLGLVACLIIGVLAVGGTPAGKGKKREKKADVERRSYQLLKPEIDLALAEGQDAREIGGVRIELTRISFEITPMYFVTVQQRETKWESWTGLRVGTAAPVWIGALPFYEIEPDNLRFRLRITNHLGRVLRLEGVAIQFTKDGEPLEVDYAENDLNKVIILPEKSWEGMLHGPDLAAFGLKEFDARTATGEMLESPEVASEGVLLVGLYDVITETDEASNPTKRSNFQWIYGYTASAVPEQAEAIRWKAKLTEEQAQAIVGNHRAEDLAATLPGE